MSQAQANPLGAATEISEAESEFSALLTREFRPKSARAREAVEAAVHTLAQQALADSSLVSNDSLHSIDAMIRRN